MLIAIWLVAALLLALWSAAAWGLHTLLVLGAAWTGDPAALVDRVPQAELLDLWLPGWRGATVLALQFAQHGLAWLGDAAGLVAWIVWGAGASLLLLCAATLALLLRWVRRQAAPQPSPSV